MASCTLEQRSLHLPLPVGFLLAKRHICRPCFLEVRLWDAGFVCRWLTEEGSWDQHLWGSGGGKTGHRRKLKWDALTARPQLILQGTGWPIVDLGCPRKGSRPWRGSFHCPGEEVHREWSAAHTLSRGWGWGSAYVPKEGSGDLTSLAVSTTESQSPIDPEAKGAGCLRQQRKQPPWSEKRRLPSQNSRRFERE